MSSILVYGCILFDHIGENYYIGGCNTNVAAHCARLGLETSMVSAVGADQLGDQAIKWMKSQGINTDYINQLEEYPTGTTEVDLRDSSNPQYYLTENVGYDHITLTPKQFREIRSNSYDFMYFSTSEQRRENGESVKTLYELLEHVDISYRFFDANLRKNCFTDEMLIRSLQHTNILKVNDEELQYLAKHILHTNGSEMTIAHSIMKEFPTQIVIVTKGSRGASAYTAEKEYFEKAENITVVDTVGSGDAFSAAFIANYGKGKNIISALKLGNKLGGYVAGKRSAVPDYSPELLNILGATSKQ